MAMNSHSKENVVTLTLAAVYFLWVCFKAVTSIYYFTLIYFQTTELNKPFIGTSVVMFALAIVIQVMLFVAIIKESKAAWRILFFLILYQLLSRLLSTQHPYLLEKAMLLIVFTAVGIKNIGLTRPKFSTST